jgi:hypothetical protein
MKNPSALSAGVNVPGSQKILYYAFLAILIVGILVGFTWANYQFSMQNPGGNDFLARWMGAHYWVTKGISPYDQQVSVASQVAIYGRPANPKMEEDVAHFVYPANALVFLAPFGLLDYTWARALWMTLLEITLILSAVLSLRMVGWSLRPPGLIALVLFSLLWYPAVRTIILGQYSGLNSFLIILSLFLVVKKKDVWAGILLALSTAKPQMVFLLVPFILLWALSTKRYQILASFFLSSAAMLVVSMILLPGWPMQWLQQMRDYPSYTSRIGIVVDEMAALIPAMQKPIRWLLYGITGLYLAFEWLRTLRQSDNIRFLWTTFLTLVVTNMIAFRTATPHFVLFLPALLLVFGLWESTLGRRAGLAIGITTLIFLFGYWALFIATVQGNEEQAIMYYPVPVAILLLLLLARSKLPQKLAIEHKKTIQVQSQP